MSFLTLLMAFTGIRIHDLFTEPALPKLSDCHGDTHLN